MLQQFEEAEVDDVNELRQELRRLKRKIDRIEGAPAVRERQELDQIVGHDDETPIQRTADVRHPRGRPEQSAFQTS